MTSLFSRSKSKKAAALKQTAGHPSSSDVPPPAGQSGEPVDEYGRVIPGGYRQRVGSEPARPKNSNLPMTPPSSQSKRETPLPPIPQWHFAATHIPPPPHVRQSSNPEAAEISWGLMSEGSRVILGLQDAGRLVEVLCGELSRRGLSTSLLFSSLALDVSAPKIKSIIQSFLTTILPPGTFRANNTRTTPQERAWVQEVGYSGERELAWVLRWGLSRILRVRGAGEEKRGLVDFELFEDWRGREKTASYPPTHFHAFTAACGPELQPILVNLFGLFSRLTAHSHLGGCTPSVIAGYFGPLLFGLPASSLVSPTHTAFVRSALGTEHLILAFIRSQSASSNITSGGIPGRLEFWIKGYPSMLPSDRFLASGEPRRGAKVIRSESARKDVRAYSKELFRSGETWAVEYSAGGGGVWKAWSSRIAIPARGAPASSGATMMPKFSNDYRKRLHVPSTLPPLVTTAGGWEDLGSSSSHGHGDEEDDGSGQWKTMVDKKWGDFMEAGFDGGPNVDRTGSISKKLEFDLSEGAKAHHAEKRETLSWHDFSAAGFSRTDDPLARSLGFSHPVQKDILDWPAHREEVRKRLKKLQKDLPSFEYDTRPRLGGEILLEEVFVDAWVDLLLSGGWMDREETTLRECNWAIVQYKALPLTAGRSAFAHEDPRSDDMYVVYEEIVPVEYQARLRNPKKQSFGLFSPKRSKKSSSGAESLPDTSSRRVLSRDKEEEFESMMRRGGPPKVMSMYDRRPPSDVPPSPQPPIQHLPPPPAPPPPSKPAKTIKPVKSATSINIGGGGGGLFKSKTSKKTAKAIQGSVPFEESDINFEMRTASSEDGSPKLKNGHARGVSRDDMWIDVMVTAGGGAGAAAARRNDKQAAASNSTDASGRARQRTSSDPSTPMSSAAFSPTPAATFTSQPISDESSRFYENANSEVGIEGADQPLGQGPAILVRSPTSSTVATHRDQSQPRPFSYADDEDIQPVDTEIRTLAPPGGGRAMGLPASPKPVRKELPEGDETGDERVLQQVRDSVMTEYSQEGTVDTETEGDLTPTPSKAEQTFEPMQVRGVSPGSYVHGQPLHNLPEAEEEEEEDEPWPRR